MEATPIADVLGEGGVCASSVSHVMNPTPLPRCTAISCSFSHSSYLIFNNYYFKRKPFQARPHLPLTVCC